MPANYVTTCARLLGLDDAVGVVGGVQRPIAVEASVSARGVARALRNPWLLGGAAYRRRGLTGAVDTVYLGAFRRTELTGLGGYDTRLDANEDFDLCARYRDAGFVVWLDGDLVVEYEPRRSLSEVFRQYRSFGAAKVHFWRSTGRRPNRRQQIALGTAALGGALAVGATRRPRLAGAFSVGGLLALVALDQLADPAEPELAVRAASCSASVAIVAGWLTGIGWETCRLGPRKKP